MPFWKARVEQPSPITARLLKSMALYLENGGMVCRFTFADGSFEYVAPDRTPQFSQGEHLILTFHEDLLVVPSDEKKAEAGGEWVGYAELVALRKNAERYHKIRRGQHWSVIDGLGDTLRANTLDAAVDARSWHD